MGQTPISGSLTAGCIEQVQVDSLPWASPEPSPEGVQAGMRKSGSTNKINTPEKRSELEKQRGLKASLLQSHRQGQAVPRGQLVLALDLNEPLPDPGDIPAVDAEIH